MWKIAYYKFGKNISSEFEGCFCLINLEEKGVKFTGYIRRDSGFYEGYDISNESDIEDFYEILSIKRVL